MRVIVCGPRHWTDEHAINYAFGELDLDHAEELTIVQGGATGVDRIAARLSKLNGVDVEEFPAAWNLHGKAAGPIRNAQMLSRGADLVVAFRRGEEWTQGTLNLVKQAHAAGVPISVVMVLPEGNVCFREYPERALASTAEHGAAPETVNDGEESHGR